MARRQRDDPAAQIDKERVVEHNQCARRPVGKGGECAVEIAFAGRSQQLDPQPDGASSGLNIAHVDFGIGVVRIHEHGDNGDRRH